MITAGQPAGISRMLHLSDLPTGRLSRLARSPSPRPSASILPVRRWAERRRVVLAAAIAVFVSVFALSHASTEAADGVVLLYVVAIALFALELGLLAGVCASLLALGLVGVWVADSNIELGAVGFITSAASFVAVGALAGWFGDRMRDAQTRQQLLLETGLTLAHLDLADDLPTSLAEQAHRMFPGASAQVQLEDHPVRASARAAEGRADEVIPIELRGTRYGTLSLDRPPTTPEDRASLEMLALQGAIAAESRRLLESERERAVIGAQLQEANRRLQERSSQLRELIDRQEALRHQVAYELREQAAQTLAAVLLALGALERDIALEEATPALEELRSDIDSTLRSLRTLAGGLRPALELGLHPALEGLADDTGGRDVHELRIALPDPRDLDDEVRTVVYRVAEEALDAVGAASLVSVHTQADGRELAIEVIGTQPAIPTERLAVLQARIELVGGTLTTSENELRAVIPLIRPARQTS